MLLQNWFNEIQRSFWHQLQVAFDLTAHKNNVSERKKIVILNDLKECADEKFAL